MYKDVWKKFGVKIFVVLCSILLVGGVAVAAPKLQADPLYTQLPTGATLTAHSMSYGLDVDRFDFSSGIGEVQEPKNASVGTEQKPRQVFYHGPNNEEEILDIGTHYMVSSGAKDVGTGQQCEIRMIKDSTYFANGTVLRVTYDITKQQNNAVSCSIKPEKLSNGNFVASGTDYTLQKGDVNVILTLNDGRQIYVPENDYTITPDSTPALGQRTSYTITLNNFTGMGIVSCTPLKSVSGLELIMDSPYDNKSIPTDATTDTLKNAGVVHIMDGGTEVTDKVNWYLDKSGVPSINITGRETEYVGEKSFPLTYTSDGRTIGLPAEFTSGPIDYDDTRTDGKGYIKIPNTLLYKDENGTVINTLVLGNSNGDGDFYVLENEVNVSNWATGLVEMQVHGNGGYSWINGQRLYYNFRRDLDDAKIVTSPDVETINNQKMYIFDNATPFEPTVTVQFGNGDVVPADAYEVTFENSTNDNMHGTITKPSDRNATKYAGDVTIYAKGKGSSSSGGFYHGNANQAPLATFIGYKINAKELSKDTNYALRLGLGDQNGNENRTLYTGSAAPVTKSAYVTRTSSGGSDTVRINQLTEADYYCTYEKLDEDTDTWSGVNEAVKVGKYRVTYHFRGNYTGDLFADFTIYSLPIATSTITLNDCDRHSGAHVYDGQRHLPTVKSVMSGADIIPAEAYKVDWGENINAKDGNVGKVIVTSKTDPSDYQEVPFTIEGKQIQGSVQLPQKKPDAKYGFTSSADGWTHPYMGQDWTKQPAVPTVTFDSEDLIINEDYTLGQLVIADTNAPVTNRTYPKLNTAYKYEITGIGNYAGTAYTEEFKLEARDIGDPSITEDIPVKGKNEKTSNLEWAKKLKLTDPEFDGQILQYPTDFDIDGQVPDIDTDGKVEFTIVGKGGYEGTKRTVFFNWGDKISDAKVYDRQGREVTLKDGELWFSYAFSGTEDTMYGMEFYDGTGKKDGKIYLRYPDASASGGYVPLNWGSTSTSHYRVEFGDVVDTNDGEGDRICSVKFIGQHGYYGTKTVYFRINQNKLTQANCEITLDPGDPKLPYTYEGREIRPRVQKVEFIRSDGSREEIPEDAYRIDYTYNKNDIVNAGTRRFYIVGLGEYSGRVYKEFTIEKRDFGEAWRKDMIRIEGLEVSYKYSPSTEINGDNLPGVRPTFKVYFNPDGFGGTQDESDTIELNSSGRTDYGVNYTEVDHVYDSSNSYDIINRQKPTITVYAGDLGNGVRPVNSNNFTGSFEEHFDITPISLTECEITTSPTRPFFTGLEVKPTVIVKYNGVEIVNVAKDASGNVVQENIEYTVQYDHNVTVGTLADEGIAYVTAVEGGNLTGKNEQVRFNVTGDLNPQKDSNADKNSDIIVTVNPVDYISKDNPFGTNPQFFSQVVFRQRDNRTGTATEDDFFDVPLIQGTDYTVSCSATTVGRHTASIDGQGRFSNSYPSDVLIRGDLSNSAITTFTDPGEIALNYTSGSAISAEEFAEMIAPVMCGGRRLDYDKDYVFDKAVDSTPGPHTLTILPKPGSDAVNWLRNSCDVNYVIKQNMAGIDIQGLKSTYEYNHGRPVVDVGKLVVTMNGKPLAAKHYDIELVNGVNVDEESYILITGKGDYKGTSTKFFTIEPYDLKKAYDENRLVVLNQDGNVYTGNEEAVYSGKEVFPEVTVQVSETRPIDLTLNTDYRIVGNTGDRENVTRGEELPTFAICNANSNYKGRIPLTYRIVAQSIRNVEFEEIAPQKYRNNKDIKPVPRATYGARTLNGILYDSTVPDYSGYTQDFSYEYEEDCKNVGPKVIRIRGLGNFTGETTVPYEIIKKSLLDEDVTFQLLNGNPIYNGKEQIPAFELSYDGDVIFRYDGTKPVNLIMKNTTVTAENNINAGDAVLIIQPSSDDNFVGDDNGVWRIPFKIDKASLTNHTRFMYRPVGSEESENLNTYKLNLDFLPKGTSKKPIFAENEPLEENQVGIYHDNGLVLSSADYDIEYTYVEPDTEDEEVREEYRNPDPECSYAGKVRVTITGKENGNYADSACFWYFIGKDISSDASFTMQPTTTVFNSQQQYPKLSVTGVSEGEYLIARYKNEIKVDNLIEERDFVNAGKYYIRIEGDPTNGTYATKPYTLEYTITPRAFSNNLVIDGFKREYSYTGYEIRPVGISVTDYIDNVKYRLTEDVDYTLTYTNNLNAGTAYINVEGKSNFSGKATANFMITSSTISSGGTNGSNSFLDQGTGEISGATAVSPSNVNMSMDTIDAMYYTGSPVYPKVSIAGMTENVDYTVTFSNNVEVGTAVATINGIGNNNGTIIKNFRIIAQLSKCTISPIPAQQYTGSEVKPSLTVRCGNSILMEGTDYTVTYSNNVNIGTATATIRALNNANYTGSASVRFSIGNDVGGFIISGYAPSYAYTGNAITPGVVVETGSRTLTPGTDYTVSYSNNINAGTATITVTGTGRYSGTQTANFIIEPKSMQSLTTTDIADRTYTGDAYTPDITVSDGGKVLTKGVDYTVTYTNNTNPGTASILIQGTSSNYSGTKVVSFKIAAVAVKGLKASSIKYNSLKLRWTNQGYADGYQICDSQSKLVKTVKTNSATITGLTAGKTYKYKVRSYIRNADGTRSYGAFSSVLSATTKLRTPTVKVVSNAKGQARISWSKVSGATGYEIYYKKTAGAKYKKLKTVNNANVRVCTVRGMKSGDRAYFRVRAFRKNGSKKVYSSLNPLKVITVK